MYFSLVCVFWIRFTFIYLFIYLFEIIFVLFVVLVSFGVIQWVLVPFF